MSGAPSFLQVIIRYLQFHAFFPFNLFAPTFQLAANRTVKGRLLNGETRSFVTRFAVFRNTLAYRPLRYVHNAVRRSVAGQCARHLLS